MAQVTYNEEEQVFETTDEPVNDPIAEGVDNYLEQMDSLLEDGVETDEVLSSDDEKENLDGISVDSGIGQEVLEDQVPGSVEDPEMDMQYSLPAYQDSSIDLYSAVPSSAAFTPTAWQVNLASTRQLGEHYLMYAHRVYYSGSSSYWHYFLVLGDDISFENGSYTYTDCDVYSYYSYGNTVYYDRDLGSGSLDGDSTLVYSDLYFDYVGVEPAVNSYPFIGFTLLLLIFVVVMIGGRKRV